ncbi:MAG: zinc-binding alcohol dehydrogenase family protein [Chloroflexi bacterium]|nr:zinc-binding alcohol dehydrogenase family protein [Chloroflexota bacterium]
MRNLAVINHAQESLSDSAKETVEIDDIPVTFGIVSTPTPEFNRNAPENRQRVLVRKKAFSCNYRDKAVIFAASKQTRSGFFHPIGSEFAGEVVDIGSDVVGLAIGDRVIGNNHYYDNSSPFAEGVPTNKASKEYEALHYAKLINIPPQMPDEVGAAFSIGAQTVYGMIRKLNLKPGEKVLVTSAKSNTSLFAINALRQYDVSVYATSTNDEYADRLQEMGVRQLFVISPEPDTSSIMAAAGMFDCVIDPFFDLHLSWVVHLMTYNARYISCGRAGQYHGIIDKRSPVLEETYALTDVLSNVVVKNLQVIGNCVGVTEDLAQAIADYTAGRFNVVIDSVYSGKQIGKFINRSYNARGRFGKVVYKYDGA